MRIASGTLTDLSGLDDNRAKYIYSGDLGQMGTIYEFLRARHMPGVKANVYPGFAKLDDYITGLKLIWDHRVEGYWNQQTDLLLHGICTKDEFLAALHLTVEINKAKDRP